MNVYRLYDQTIKDWSASLSQWYGRLYCLAICRRVAPLYVEFVQREGWGDEAAFFLTHQLLRVSLRGDLPDSDVLADCRSRVEEFTPNTEEYTDAVYACDAGVMHLYALRCLDAYKLEWVYYVARYCYELVDAATWRIIQPEGGIVTPELEQRAEEHSLIQEEVCWQAVTREQLATVPEGDVTAAESFLQRSVVEPIIRHAVPPA